MKKLISLSAVVLALGVFITNQSIVVAVEDPTGPMVNNQQVAIADPIGPMVNNQQVAIADPIGPMANNQQVAIADPIGPMPVTYRG